MCRALSVFLIISILLVSSFVANSYAFLQTSLKMEPHLNPGESQTFQWGLKLEEGEEGDIKLRAEGEGKELLSFPEVIHAKSGEWNTVDITISIPEDYPNNVILKPAIFALFEGKEGSAVKLNIQMQNIATITIGNPIIEEVKEEKPQIEIGEEMEEDKSLEKNEQDGTFSITSTEEQAEEGGGCLISTATFGSELAPQVQMLREIRDNKLLATESGHTFLTAFNTLYYSFSPTIADLERQSPIFQQAVKLAITPLISSLSILNYVDMDSEAEVLGYGISLILLNVAMYFVAPAIIISRLKR